MSQNIASPRRLSVHKEHELLLRLEAAGLGDAEAQFVIDSKGNELARNLVALIRNRNNVSYQTAQAIMGKNYLGLEQSSQHFQLRTLISDMSLGSVVPFSKDVLEACKDTHVLVACRSMSVMDLREKAKHLFYSQGFLWYLHEEFAKECPQANWHLVRKTIVPNSTSKTWREQRYLLSRNEETPTAQVLVYTILLYYLATGERLLPNIYARVSDLDSDGDRVYVGFEEGGLFIGTGRWADLRTDDIGLSSARKPA